jgi:hypothetical protein
MGIAFKPALTGVLLAVVAPAQGVSGATLGNPDFEGYPVASNQELAALRGGFEVNIGGQLLSLAFSLERVSYLNGELLASTRIVVPDIAAAILSPQAVSVSTYVAPPVQAENPPVAGGAAGNQTPSSPQITNVVVPSVGSATEGGNASGQDAASYVTLIQNGVGNSVALPAEVNRQVDQQVNQAIQAAQAQVLQAINHATVIQNTLDDQVIRNMTTLNVTLTNAALARAVELNAALQNVLNMPVVVP